jgi:hypothetical protein
LESNGKPEDSENGHGYILLVLTLRSRRNHAAVTGFPPSPERLPARSGQWLVPRCHDLLDGLGEILHG